MSVPRLYDVAGGRARLLDGVDLEDGEAPLALDQVALQDLAAAQVEPRCGDRSGLADNASTKLVQSALKAKSISTTVDGWYGNGTTTAYATWQRRQGYSGIDANGLPGVRVEFTDGCKCFLVATVEQRSHPAEGDQQ